MKERSSSKQMRVGGNSGDITESEDETYSENESPSRNKRHILCKHVKNMKHVIKVKNVVLTLIIDASSCSNKKPAAPISSTMDGTGQLA